MDIKYALFDMDGTIVNSLFYWEEKWKELGERFLNEKNYTVPDYIDKNVRTMKLEECAVYVKRQLNLNVSDSEIFDFFNNGMLDFYYRRTNLKKGIERLIEYFYKNGVKMCLATATEGDVAKEVMRFYNLGRYFEEIVSCTDEDVNEGKESPAVYLKALNILKADVRNTVLFEDSPLAVETARKLGMMTVGIEDRYSDRTGKIKEIADIFIPESENIFESFKKQIEAYNGGK